MGTFKRLVTVALGLALSASGAWLRLSAKDLAWPKKDFVGYSGPRENTEWAIKEHAYRDLGLTILVFGLAMLLIATANWLWARPSNVESKDWARGD